MIEISFLEGEGISAEILIPNKSKLEIIAYASSASSVGGKYSRFAIPRGDFYNTAQLPIFPELKLQNSKKNDEQQLLEDMLRLEEGRGEKETLLTLKIDIEYFGMSDDPRIIQIITPTEKTTAIPLYARRKNDYPRDFLFLTGDFVKQHLHLY